MKGIIAQPYSKRSRARQGPFVADTNAFSLKAKKMRKQREAQMM